MGSLLQLPNILPLVEQRGIGQGVAKAGYMQWRKGNQRFRVIRSIHAKVKESYMSGKESIKEPMYAPSAERSPRPP